MILLDVGVWLAAIWDGHVLHRPAAEWFDAQDENLALCRVTQMGMLRLLSNPTVMRDDVLTRGDAWMTLDDLRADPRIHMLAEPPGLEQVWRALSAQNNASHKLWTDDYLAAFAQASGLRFATIDQACAKRYPALKVELLL